MSFVEVFRKFTAKLVTSLPMKDVVFLAKLNAKGLFSGNLKAQVKAMSTAAEATDHFLDNKIEKDLINGYNDSFLQLLSVMEEHSESLKKLATEIKEELKVDILPATSNNFQSTSITGKCSCMAVQCI